MTLPRIFDGTALGLFDGSDFCEAFTDGLYNCPGQLLDPFYIQSVYDMIDVSSLGFTEYRIDGRKKNGEWRSARDNTTIEWPTEPGWIDPDSDLGWPYDSRGGSATVKLDLMQIHGDETITPQFPLICQMCNNPDADEKPDWTTEAVPEPTTQPTTTPTTPEDV